MVKHKNVVVCVYNAYDEYPFTYSHAYFSKAAFNEAIESSHFGEGKIATSGFR